MKNKKFAKKIAILVEGQSELIFIRRLLICLSQFKINFDCLELRADSFSKVPHSYENDLSKIYFLIINVGNDEKVLTVIKDYEVFFIEQNFSKIIGLRDMYSRRYRELAQKEYNQIHNIVPELNQKIISASLYTISNMQYPDRIKLFFSIMELEAWWLSMYKILEKFNKYLTYNFINKELKYDLSQLDPELAFFHPSSELDNIFRLVGQNYQKHRSDVESLLSTLDDEDILIPIVTERCSSFCQFFNEISQDLDPYLH